MTIVRRPRKRHPITVHTSRSVTSCQGRRATPRQWLSVSSLHSLCSLLGQGISTGGTVGRNRILPMPRVSKRKETSEYPCCKDAATFCRATGVLMKMARQPSAVFAQLSLVTARMLHLQKFRNSTSKLHQEIIVKDSSLLHRPLLLARLHGPHLPMRPSTAIPLFVVEVYGMRTTGVMSKGELRQVRLRLSSMEARW